MVHFPQFRLGVSRSNTLALGLVMAEVYRAPAGWRVALAAELVAAGMHRRGARHPRQYYDQAG